MNTTRLNFARSLKSLAKCAWGLLAVCALLASTSGISSAAVLLEETFADDPVVNHRAMITGSATRFDFDDTSDKLTAHYNTKQPTAKMIWPLGRTLDETVDFRFEVDLTFLDAGFHATPNRAAQIAFGLINSITTGDNRVGGGGGDGFDIVTVDYFPNELNPIFSSPTFTPTVIRSNDGGGFFSHVLFAQGSESGLNDFGESDLPRDVALTAIMSHETNGQGDRMLTLQIEDSSGPLMINGGFIPGGFDGDNTTIQLCTNCGAEPAEFSVDSFAFTLWEDTFLPAEDPASVIADVEITRILVEADLPLVPGDANGDGRVDATDLAIVLANWRTGTTLEEGNLDGLNSVDAADLAFLFGSGPSGDTASENLATAGVPEPSALHLILVGLAIWCVFCRVGRAETRRTTAR